METNPEKFVWEAPTKNKDGTPIKYELEYELGLVGDDAKIRSLMVVPGQLRENDGRYEAPIADAGLDYGVHKAVIRSFNKATPDKVSQWSEPVEFVLSEEVPKTPVGFTVK